MSVLTDKLPEAALCGPPEAAYKLFMQLNKDKFCQDNSAIILK
jgi:hypothetical protein